MYGETFYGIFKHLLYASMTKVRTPIMSHYFAVPFTSTSAFIKRNIAWRIFPWTTCTSLSELKSIYHIYFELCHIMSVVSDSALSTFE